jgi:hypothetical protein
LKIDAEASESKVIRGAIQTLRQHRPFIICEVLENVDHRFVQDTLEGLGYLFFHIQPACLMRHPHLLGCLGVDQRNYLFTPVEKETTLAEICRAAAIPIHNSNSSNSTPPLPPFTRGGKSPLHPL